MEKKSKFYDRAWFDTRESNSRRPVSGHSAKEQKELITGGSSTACCFLSKTVVIPRGEEKEKEVAEGSSAQEVVSGAAPKVFAYHGLQTVAPD